MSRIQEKKFIIGLSMLESNAESKKIILVGLLNESKELIKDQTDAELKPRKEGSIS